MGGLDEDEEEAEEESGERAGFIEREVDMMIIIAEVICMGDDL